MAAMAGPDLNDVDYDAYLANERTLDDPDVIRVERNGEVRLRIINAGASSNFTIDLGNVQGALVAVDGNPITPLAGTRFPVAIAQRADVVLRMPPDGTAVPILALGEGRRLRTGIVLQPPGAAVSKIGASSDAMGPQVGLAQELELRASAPLAAKAAEPLHSRRPHRHHDGLCRGACPSTGWPGCRRPSTAASGSRSSSATRP